jgi:hypothetical protein
MVMGRRRVVGILVLAALLVAGWLAFRAVQIRGNLIDARASLTQLRSAIGDADPGAVRTLTEASTAHVDAAVSASSDPVWRLASRVPLIGRDFAVVRGIALTTGDVVHGVAPPAQRALTSLTTGRPVVSGGVVDVPGIAALQPDVAAAYAAAGAARASMQTVPTTALLPQVRDRRAAFVSELDDLVATLSKAQGALAVAPAMLGANGPRRYFLAVQNNAEVRGTGGLIGAYAVLHVDRGRITRQRVGSNLDFRESPTPVVDLGPEFAAHYDADSSRAVWPAAVLTPDWPSASRIIAGLWRAQTGDRIDGVIGIDPLAMAEILRVTGPVRLGSLTIGAENVVDFVMRDEYAMFEGRNDERKRLLADLAAATYDGVTSGGVEAASLLGALTAAGENGHLQVWASAPAEQRVVATSRLAGALPGTQAAFLSVVSNNATGNKSDYYIRRRVAYQRQGDGSARVSVTLRNLVAPDKVPPIVTLRADRQTFKPARGSQRQIITLYVAAGAGIRDVRVNGRAPGVGEVTMGTERGHGWASVQVEIAPSVPVEITATVDDPGGVLTYRQQPLVVDDELALDVPYRIG